MIAAIWGFAEATVFFVVPDVAVTAAALRSTRAMVLSALLAAGGAVAGGIVMNDLAQRDYASARRLVERVPAISPAMVDHAGQQIGRHGVGAFFLGSVTGTPYKIYAIHAGHARQSMPAFVLASFVARLARFLAAGLITRGIVRAMPTAWRHRRAAIILALFWIGLYAAYWGVMGF